MKHLFNDISKAEKQRILEMHGVKRNLISEAPTDTSIINFCTDCNQPQNKCGTAKLSSDSINKFSARLVTLLGGGAPMKKVNIFKKEPDYSEVVSIFQQLQYSGNFLDFCNMSSQYGNGGDVLGLCNALDKVLDETSKLKVLESLNILKNTIQPCETPKPVSNTKTKKKTKPVQKPIKKQTPIGNPPISKPGDRPWWST